MTLEQATAHNAEQSLIKILHLFLLYEMRELDMCELFETCKAARNFRKYVPITFNNTKQFIENEIFRNKVLQVFFGKLLKLKLTLCEPTHDLSMFIQNSYKYAYDLPNKIFIHDTKSFGEICKKHYTLLAICNAHYILLIDTIISRYIYGNKEEQQQMLNAIEHIKRVYPNMKIYFNLSNYRGNTLELSHILDGIDGINLLNTSITNKTLKDIALPSYIDITHKEITSLVSKSFDSVEKLKLSLNNINPYEIPTHLQELHIYNILISTINLYENQFLYLRKLFITKINVQNFNWIIPELCELYLDQCTFTTYENIANFLLLEKITIHKCNFIATDITYIKHLRKLKILELSFLDLTDFSFIPQMNLYALSVSGCNVTNEALPNFKGIKKLCLSRTEITDLTMLGYTINTPISLDISHCSWINCDEYFLNQEFITLNISYSRIKVNPGWKVEQIINPNMLCDDDDICSYNGNESF